MFKNNLECRSISRTYCYILSKIFGSGFRQDNGMLMLYNYTTKTNLGGVRIILTVRRISRIRQAFLATLSIHWLVLTIDFDFQDTCQIILYLFTEQRIQYPFQGIKRIANKYEFIYKLLGLQCFRLLIPKVPHEACFEKAFNLCWIINCHCYVYKGLKNVLKCRCSNLG